MSDIFSEEMKKEFVKLIDKRLYETKISKILDTYKDVCMDIEKNVKEINDRLVNVEDDVNDFDYEMDKKVDENKFDELEQKINFMKDVYIQQKDIEQVVGQTMLELIPNFNEKISKEIKKHLVAIAEFVIKTFKEKE